MTSQGKPQSAVFQVYLRLRPPPVPNNLYPQLTTPERFLTVEESDDGAPDHITLNPPNDNRRRAIERFAFTEVFEEEASQLDIFHGTGAIPLVEGVLAAHGGQGRDGLLATLGVTGSGKSHTILGSKSRRGLTQLSLDLLFRSISNNILDPSIDLSLHHSVSASDPSEAQVLSASGFFELLYGDPGAPSRASSRAATPMRVPLTNFHIPGAFPISRDPSVQSTTLASRIALFESPKSIRIVHSPAPEPPPVTAVPSRGKSGLGTSVPSYMQATRGFLTKLTSARDAKTPCQETSMPPQSRKLPLPKLSVNPTLPDISDLTLDSDPAAEYAVLISMYEVYNDRIFDLLTPAARGPSTKDARRRPLLFKPTEASPDRKVVAGLRKVICGNMSQALMVLEAGLHERRVAGTGSNSVSSRSHGFFCIEVKKRRRSSGDWKSSQLTIVDLAGSERARDARTQGATLAEAGKINESLMYLGQCLQMQSDAANSTKPNLVPYRQCKLTELLFSNSFPSPNSPHAARPQKATMIVTADPLGDFNATSQILRYSALAREITVPRIPSITQDIFKVSSSHSQSGQRDNCSGSHASTSSSSRDRETMELAALEIARLADELEALQDDLAAERAAREAAEAHLASAEDRILETEQMVREEMYEEMEERMATEMRVWRARWEEERERGQEHLDAKLEVLVRGLEIEDKENADPDSEASADSKRLRELETENRELRSMLARVQREQGLKSPTKAAAGRTVLGETARPKPSLGSYERLTISSRTPTPVTSGTCALPRLAGAPREGRSISRTEQERSQSSSPVKRVRRLGTRKWETGEEDLL